LTVQFTDFCELLKGLVHVLGDLGSQVDVTHGNSSRKSVSELDLLDRAVETLVKTVLEHDVWVVKHFEALVIGMLPFISPVEAVHCTALTAQTLEHIATHLTVNQLKPTQEIQFFILFVVVGELLGIQVTSVAQAKTFEIQFLERVFDIFNFVWGTVGDHDNHSLEDSISWIVAQTHQ
jgi:hypothetical protein